jgi:glycosidase
MGSHRNVGNRHVSILDDHDHVFGDKIRFSADIPKEIRDRQVAAATALQLFTLGIPCIYYGTEQAFAGPEFSEREWLPEWKSSDRYLREAMFGPEHPLKQGRGGLLKGNDRFDLTLPGFGPFGTAAHHCFDQNYPAYVRIAVLASLRSEYPALRHGRQYQRQIRPAGSEGRFSDSPAGGMVAWSRILDDEEMLCVLNANGNRENSAEIIVDANLNPEGSAMGIVFNSEETADPKKYTKRPYRKNSSLTVMSGEHGSYVQVENLGPSCVLLMTNHISADEGTVISRP